MRAASSVASDSPIASSRKQWKGEEDVWGMVHSGHIVCREPYRTFKCDDMSFRVLAVPASGRLDHIIGVADLPGTLFGHFPHAFRHAPAGQLVRMVFAHQLAVGPLEVIVRYRRRYAQYLVGIIQLLAGRVVGCTTGLAGMGAPQHGFELVYLAFR